MTRKARGRRRAGRRTSGAGPQVTLATRIYQPEVGAAVFRLRNTVRALASKGARVTVVTSAPPPGLVESEPEPPGVRVERLPVLRDRVGAVRGYVPYLSFDVPLAVRLLLRRRPDVLLAEPPPTTGLVTLAVAAVRRVPMAYFAADLLSEATEAAGAPRAVVAVVRRLEAFVLRRAALVLSVSDDVTGRAVAMGARPERFALVGNGVDTDVFCPEGPRRTGPAPLAVYAGTMSEIQGTDVFLDAVAMLRRQGTEVRLVLIGQGTRLGALRTRARALDIEDCVTFTGVLSARETAAWLRSAHVALGSAVPGTSYAFAMPTKLYAALGCGTPLLFSGTGAGHDLVTAHGFGWSVPHEAAAVAEALAEAVRAEPGPGRRRELAEWAAETVSLRAVGDRAATALLELAGRGAVPSGDGQPRRSPA